MATIRSVKKAPPKPLKPNGEESALQPEAGSEEMRQKIAEAAYYRAQQRGFSPGYELEDWLAAEAEIKRSGARSSA